MTASILGLPRAAWISTSDRKVIFAEERRDWLPFGSDSHPGPSELCLRHQVIKLGYLLASGSPRSARPPPRHSTSA